MEVINQQVVPNFHCLQFCYHVNWSAIVFSLLSGECKEQAHSLACFARCEGVTHKRNGDLPSYHDLISIFVLS